VPGPARGRAEGRGGEAVGSVSFASSSKSENPPGTLNQDFSYLSIASPDPKDGLALALFRLKSAMETKEGSMKR